MYYKIYIYTVYIYIYAPSTLVETGNQLLFQKLFNKYLLMPTQIN